MPFGRNAGYVRTYEYGCLPLVEGEQAARNEMRGRVRLWNQLVELERRYDEGRAVIAAPHLEAARGGIAGKYGDSFAATPKGQTAIARRAVGLARKDEALKAQLDALDKTEYEEARLLWLASGLYWVNHEEVKLAWQKARTGKGTLRFHSAWRDSGESEKISVRWQNGLPLSDLFSARSTLLQIDPVPAEAYSSPSRGERRRLQRTVVRFRACSGEKGKPVWVTLPMVMHRPLPPDAVLRSASLLCEKLAPLPAWRWKLVIVVTTAPPGANARSGGRASIDLGWRRMYEQRRTPAGETKFDYNKPVGLRVATYKDDAGATGEWRLSEGWLNQMGKVEDLQSIRDNAFNAFRARLSAWLKVAQVPEWLSEQTKHLGQWRSPARFSPLIRAWRKQRFAGDEAIVEALETYWERESHLWSYQVHLRDQLLRQRREQYRCWAAELAGKYGSVVVEDFDLSQMARKRNGKGPESPQEGRPADDQGARAIDLASRHQRQWAATSLLRLAVKNAFEREGLGYEVIDCSRSTMVCASCGSVERWDQARELVHTCSACDVTEDQDVGACTNLLTGRHLSQKEGV